MACALTLLGASSALAGEVGFSVIAVPDLPGEPLQVGIWYPTEAAASDQPLDLFSQHVAPDAPIEGEQHGLIIMSHGTGGSLSSHYDTALALAHAGFVVAAMTHTGDNYRDQSRAADLPARPRALHAVIGAMLADWPGHATLDPERVGVFGFSSGGFTALVAIGGAPDLSMIGPYCAAHPQTYVCEVARTHPAPAQSVAPDWIADPRIRAAVIAAPALGFAFAPSGLAAVRIPIQLWRAADDRVLPSPDYAEAVKDALPRPPEYHVVAGADHFDFLAPCSQALAAVAPGICQEHGDFDRPAFHQAFNAKVVGFLQQALR